MSESSQKEAAPASIGEMSKVQSDNGDPKVPVSGSARWPRDATILMLAYVNLLDDLFSGIDGRQKRLETLSELLTKELQEPYSAARIEAKIERLWKKHRRDSSSSSLDHVYNYGVKWATLPLLEYRGEATFQEIQEKIEVLKK